MSIPIPERRDLGQLRRQAKELRDAARRDDAGGAERIARHYRGTLQGAVTLAVAQLVIAREQGFASWPKLKAASDADASARRVMEEFLAASVEGRMRQAASILQAAPGIAGRSLRAAAVLGDVRAAREVLTADPAAAAAIDERGWPPLLYACYSRWHQADPSRAPAIAEVARLLLDAGASPNTNNGASTPGLPGRACGSRGKRPARRSWTCCGVTASRPTNRRSGNVTSKNRTARRTRPARSEPASWPISPDTSKQHAETST